MRVLLDTNVILDAVLQRPPWHAEADAILQAAGLGQVVCAATTLSDAIITRNVADFAHSPVPAWEPGELLKRLAAAGSPPAAGAGPGTGVP